MDVVAYNQQAWDDQVKNNNEWTIPVSADQIELAKKGNVQVVLTPVKTVPASWFPDFRGLKLLALASGGGQQGPLFAAAGAEVTVFDLSSGQLKQDEKTALQYGLKIKTMQGDMANLSAFADASFDLIFHPCSNSFAPELLPVWKECARVLKKGGILLWGFTKAESMLMVENPTGSKKYDLRYKMPYSDVHSLNEKELSVYTDKNEPIIFGHSLEDQIGMLLKNGFQLTDLFEDDWGGREAIDEYFKSFVAARAVRI